MKTFEELKQEAIARGIVPGAKVIVPFVDDEVFTVQPFDCWELEFGNRLAAAIDKTGGQQAWVCMGSDWATVVPKNDEQ